ncbi:MAG: penicillin-binding protein activator LpoB [Treponema sp.]|jgi:hypothetical protein|nr:penicillin-binding protein activator LpoB [Treponema sp.]
MRYIARFVLFMFAALGLGACATSIAVQVTKPPNMDTSGIERIAVMPFSTTGYTTLDRQVAQELTSAVTEIVLRTGHFTLVDAADVARRQSMRESLVTYVDGIFTGEITSLRVNDSSKLQESKNKDEKPTIIWTREVSLNFVYRISRTRDSSIIAQARKSDWATSSSYDTRDYLEDPFVMAQRLIRYQLSNLARDIAPWTIQERRTLAQETSKDKALKQRMKDAERLVKERSYRSALNAFSAIYAETGSFAAGYNTAIMTEIVDSLPEAITLMQRLANATSNPKATSELARMQRTLAETETVATKFAEPSGVVDSAIKQASKEILARLPVGSKVSLLKVSIVDAELMDYIIAELSAAFINAESISLVDRQNRDLLEAEQRFQLSGAVDDESAVSIGHLLGVDTLVMCSIAGSGSLRRLVVQMLSVETGELVWQVSQEI